MIALVDGNNFFVSCERVFAPSLRHWPVAVLSSNDGCVVARSDDIKPLIPMGVPVFKVRTALAQRGVVLKSSNFALYSDMSRRMMATLKHFSPEIEVYSIDEAFLQWPGGTNPYDLRQTVLRDTGIPVSVGVGRTRVLAKAATELAKNQSSVMDWSRTDEKDIDTWLHELPIENVWGVAGRLGQQLRLHRIRTAYDLKHIPNSILESSNITLQRLVGELRGQPYHDTTTTQSKSMISTRSFGKSVSSKSSLSESLSSHAAHIGAKLRRKGLVAGRIEAFISTGKKGAVYSDWCRVPVATDDTRELIRIVRYMLSRIYHPNMYYKKAGVMAYELTPVQQLMFDSEETDFQCADTINRTVDGVNDKWGAYTIRFAAEGINQTWHSRHDLRSQRYTTEWSELKHVK